ncbi:6-phospho-beta-glucosidase [Ancrocorticia populi]|uniref:6-phospho-beta-glucosidase n=1 Tax=Ancrocorticia populi TaxID=2175228 RepID=UPI003F9BEFF6
MKLTIIGGGGFRVPQIVEALSRRDDLDVSELRLYDVSAERLEVMADVLEQLPIARKPRIVTGTDLREAVRGVDFVFSAMRVAGTEGRVSDELIALSHGILGQETVGPGGYAYALRTIPAALDLARAVKEEAPNAWVINFTNPAGIITQAMREVLGPRVIGICDTPIGLVRRAARALGTSESELDYDYIGLNHLGWLRSATKDGEELLPRLLEDPELLTQMEEARLIGLDWVRSLGMLPNEYLFYYYRNREAVAQIRDEAQTRGQFLSAQQGDFYQAAHSQPQEAAALWDCTHREREETYMAEAREVAGAGEREEEDLDGGYQEVALDLMTALSGGRPARMILGVANAGVIPALADSAIIEVPCTVDQRGPVAVALAPLEGAELGLVTQVKACETLVIDAVRTKDRATAWKALALHPLVDSVDAAKEMLDEYCEAIPQVAAVFEEGR